MEQRQRLPEKPGESGESGEPDEPGEPGEPGESDEPGEPGEPSERSEPGEPGENCEACRRLARVREERDRLQLSTLFQNFVEFDELQRSEACETLAWACKRRRSLNLNGLFRRYSSPAKRIVLELVFTLVEMEDSLVESLFLQNNGIGADCFPRGSRHNLAKLKSLDLSQNPIPDVSFLQPLTAGSVQTLSKLSVSSFQDAGLKALAESFPVFQQLRELSLEASANAASGMEAFATSLARSSSLQILRVIILPANDGEEWPSSVLVPFLSIFQKGRVSHLEFVKKESQLDAADESDRSVVRHIEDCQLHTPSDSCAHDEDLISDEQKITFPKKSSQDGVSQVDLSSEEMLGAPVDEHDRSIAHPEDSQLLSSSDSCLHDEDSRSDNRLQPVQNTLPELREVDPPVIQNTPVNQGGFVGHYPYTGDETWIYFDAIQLSCLYSVDRPAKEVCFLFRDASDMASLFGVGRQTSMVQIHPNATERGNAIVIKDWSKTSWEKAWKSSGVDFRSSGTTDESKSRLKNVVEAGFKCFMDELLKRHRCYLREKSRDLSEIRDAAQSRKKSIHSRGDGNTSREETGAGWGKIGNAKDTARPTFTSHAEGANGVVLQVEMDEDRFDLQSYNLKQTKSVFRPSMTIELINDSFAPQGWSTVMNVELRVGFQIEDVVQSEWTQDSLCLSLECDDQDAVILKDESITSQLIPESKDSRQPNQCLANSPEFVISRRSTGSTMRYRSFWWNRNSTERIESQRKVARDDVRDTVSCVNIEVKGSWQLLGDEINVHKLSAEKELRQHVVKKGTHSKTFYSQVLSRLRPKKSVHANSSCIQTPGVASDSISKHHELGTDIRVLHNFSPSILHEGFVAAQQLFTL